MPATNVWVGPTTNALWSNPANWSLGHSPQSTDDLKFGAAFGGTNTNSTDDVSVNVVSIVCDSAFTSTITVNTNINWTAGFVEHYGGLNLQGTNTISAGDHFYEYGVQTAFSTNSSITCGDMNVYGSSGSVIVFGGGGPGVSNLSISAHFRVYAGASLTVGASGASAARLDLNSTVEIQGQATVNAQSLINHTSASSILLSGTMNLFSATVTTVGGINVANGLFVTNGIDTINGSLQNSGGTVRFAGSTHILTINGGFGQFLGSLEMRLQSSFSNDRINASTASLGGNLTVTNLGPPPGIGNIFTLIATSGGVSGMFSTIVWPPAPPGPPPGQWAVIFGNPLLFRIGVTP